MPPVTPPARRDGRRPDEGAVYVGSMRPALPLALLATLAGLAACASATHGGGGDVAQGYAPSEGAVAGAAPVAGRAMTLRRLGTWTYTGIGEPRREVIRSAGNWRAFWRELDAGPQPPVDFAREAVVAVTLGRQPHGGYEIRIARVAETPDGTMTVEVVETAPGPGCRTTQARTQPADLVTVPATAARSARQWKFVERHELRECG